MKKSKEVNPIFRLWRENKIVNEYRVFASDLRQSFQKWLGTKETNWIEYYYGEQTVIAFLTSKDGLNSTFDPIDLPEIYRLLKPDMQKFLSVS